MAKYMVVHTMIREPEEVLAYWREAAPQFGAWMAGGQTPARCLYTWIPIELAEHREVYCLWEGENAEQVMLALQQSGIEDYMGAQIIQVEETGWSFGQA